MAFSSFGPAFAADYKIADDCFSGRVIARHSADQECIDLASAWIERCSRLHGASCYSQADVPLPTRLVRIPTDAIQNPQLRVTKGHQGRYVALSYSWGKRTDFVTTSTTFAGKLSGFKVETLPQMLQDAIQVARKLGYYYIWIDALYIIRGDEVDWAHESSKMAVGYGNSSLTVFADVSGRNKELKGIFRKRNRLCSHHLN